MYKMTEEESQMSIELDRESTSTEYLRYCKEIQEEWDEIVKNNKHETLENEK